MEQSTVERFKSEKSIFFHFLNDNDLRSEAIKALNYVVENLKKPKVKKALVVKPKISPRSSNLCEEESLKIFQNAWNKANILGMSQKKFVDFINERAASEHIQFKRKLTRGVLSNILNNTKRPYEDVASFIKHIYNL